MFPKRTAILEMEELYNMIEYKQTCAESEQLSVERSAGPESVRLSPLQRKWLWHVNLFQILSFKLNTAASRFCFDWFRWGIPRWLFRRRGWAEKR